MYDTKEAFYHEYLSRKHFGSLDGLRFVCILLVLWHHSPAFGTIENPLRILTRGFSGVDFFFVLSGFLITTLLLREQAQHGSFSLRGFYFRRALRILPVYYLVVTAVSVYFVLWKGYDQYAAMVPYYYGFFANMLKSDIPLLSPTWSLSVEEQFYLLWPLALMLLPNIARVQAWFLALLVTLCLVGMLGWHTYFGISSYETSIAIWKISVGGFSAILIGALCAVLLHSKTGFSVLFSLCGARWMPVIGVAVLLTLYQMLPSALWGLPTTVMHLTMAVILVSIVVREDHVLARLFQMSLIRRIGQISYGVYLYHLIALHISHEVLAPFGITRETGPWAISLLMLVMAVVISEISFRYYETPFLRLRHRG